MKNIICAIVCTAVVGCAVNPRQRELPPPDKPYVETTEIEPTDFSKGLPKDHGRSADNISGLWVKYAIGFVVAALVASYTYEHWSDKIEREFQQNAN